MTDSMSNKELIAVGHEFARTLSSDTPIIDMAKMFTRLAERLDCTTAVLREMTKLRDALEAREVTLPENITSANAPEVFEISAEAKHLGLRGIYASYAVGWNARGMADKEALTSAGIRINGEG